MPGPILCASPGGEDPLSRSYRVNLPSSLTVIHSSALVYSTRPRVSVCGTGAAWLELSGFSRESDYARYCRSPKALAYSQGRLKPRICLGPSTPTPFNGLFRQPAALSLFRLHVAPCGSTGILTGSAIGLACRLSLRTRLTLIPDPISVDQETLVLRRAGFSPALSLLIPTFAFPNAPVRLAPCLLRNWNAPLPMTMSSRGFGSMLMPDYYPCQIPRLVSCYALFK